MRDVKGIFLSEYVLQLIVCTWWMRAQYHRLVVVPLLS